MRLVLYVDPENANRENEVLLVAAGVKGNLEFCRAQSMPLLRWIFSVLPAVTWNEMLHILGSPEDISDRLEDTFDY